MSDLIYRCAVITGASAGLGEEFARQLAPVCGKLILLARREDRLRELAKELEDEHEHLMVDYYLADLTQRDMRSAFIAEMQEEEEYPDLLVNNAGMGDYGEFLAADWNKTEAMLEVNINALTHLSHGLAPKMKELGGGAILNVSSLASSLPIPDFTVYAASKAYVTSFSEALRMELQEHNIAVTALCPGPVHTEFGSVAQRQEGGKDFGARELFYVEKEKVVRQALEGLWMNKARVYPGLIVAAASVGIALLPMVAVRLIMGRRPRRVLPD